MEEKHYIGPEAIIEKKKKYIMPCLAHFYRHPQQLVKGSMQYLWDSTGKKYLDMYAGVSVMNCGHANPDILSKMKTQMDELQSNIDSNQIKIESIKTKAKNYANQGKEATIEKKKLIEEQKA